uniref:TF-B3 domain-containing protein n=1 Tax=Setaria viridis TaxID=4556 RepID=A0A4U6UWM6_SETVI|nr:B3 domain-containing transcription factor NGA1-like [Setaria viridis]TKW15657.1 hypothetical protein SEVIR_5G251900v2 [Setaria viridis]
MAFLATRLSREMEVQMEKVALCENPFHMVNPFLSRLYVSPWVSMSTPILPSGLSNSHGRLGLWGAGMRGRQVIEIEFLFSKILTPSDVGKQNRLLIPKKFAEKYFPKISKTKSYREEQILAFEDSSTGLVWHFRFSLWHSSNTYVLTKGWPSFTKEKKLSNGDTVSFYRSADKSEGTNCIFIHIKPHVGISSVPHHSAVPMFTPSSLLNETDKCVCEGLGLGSGYRFEPTWKHLSFGSGGLTPPMTLMPQPTMFPESMSLDNSMGRAQKRLRLFGVDIDVPPRASGDDSCNGWTNGVA